MERAQRERTDLAVALADVDHFKHINDTYGHLAGDALLREVAQRMLGSVRSYDFVGRYGGEEFLLVLPGLSAHGPFHRLTQLQQGTSGRPFVYRNRSIHLTTSFGVAWMEQDGMTVEDMVRRADEALYRAKAAGRDRIVFYNAPAADGHP
jgi:diguanylate cyclase (GGDEF)-like protein